MIGDRMNTPTCPKCSKKMEEGFIVDHSHAINMQAEWIEGAPQRAFWTGLKLRGKVRRPVATFCCPSCGYLESFAQIESG
jgi:hypothetical protein